MKQYITEEQLQEYGKITFKEFAKKFNFDLSYIHDYVIGKDIATYELITIGKMIEILESKLDNIDIFQVVRNKTIGWEFTGWFKGKSKGFNSERKIELVDALWEAVKHILLEDK